MKTKKSFSSLVKPWKFGYINPNIEKYFQLESVRSEEYKLFNFDRHISSQDAVDAIEKDGYVPANLHELLLWKDWNKADYVIALGQSARVGGDRDVPGLWHDGGTWGLVLSWWDRDWDSSDRFLAVRDKSFETKKLDPETSETLTLSAAIKVVKEAGYQISKIV